MIYGIVNQCLAALRREPFERSEMVSQLLFGETFTVYEQHKGWLRVSVTHDSYEGWLDSKLCLTLNSDDFDWIKGFGDEKCATHPFSAQRVGDEYPIKLCPGSSLFQLNFDLGEFKLANEMYKIYSVPFDSDEGSILENISKIAVNYINSPYLWGGRSPYGIDCSGLVQVVFKSIGYKLPRDASQQVKMGATVDFVNLTQSGDLAFFDNEDGNITHVGIVLPNGEIIHSSGFVRIDKLDQQGIFCVKTQTYSHKLRIIKRVL